MTAIDSQDFNSLPLADHYVVVTGSSTGIGRAIVLAMASAGANVLLHARSSLAELTEVREQIAALGRQATHLLADLSKPEECEKLVTSAWEWNPIDCWVNNAGVDTLTGQAAEWPFEKKLAALWEVDVRATIHLSRAVGALMKQRGTGVILNIGWDQAEIGMAGDSGELYAATKGAVTTFSRSLAKSLAPQVRVNCIAPGWIRTEWGKAASEYWDKRARQESLLKRWGEPEDIAGAAVFLASPFASFITGETLRVSGGFAGHVD